MEEFILRIGANASALKNELTRTGAWAKAWATTLVEDLHGKLGRMFAAGFVLDKGMEFAKRTLENIQEKILAVRRAQGELPGVSANFIQGVFNFLERIGLSYESASKPLLKFKQILDAAKANPVGEEMRMLQHYNIVTSEADLKTQKYATSIAKLSEAYLKSGKNLKVLKDLIGRESLSPALLALLELGPQKLENMNKFNFFSDISQNALNVGAGLFGAKKGLGQILTATTANLMEKLAVPLLSLIPAGGGGPGSNTEMLLNMAKEWLRLKGEAANAEEEETRRMTETIQQEESRVNLQTKFIELKEKERELSAEIADQGKATLDQMANEARRMGGAPEPRLFGITPRMRDALKIKNLETKARIAFEQGHDSLHDQLMAQAQQMRAARSWLMDKDQNPMKKTETELAIVNRQLEPVKKMAEFANKHSD